MPLEIDPNKYFSIEIDARPGINHLKYSLDLLIRESVSLGRTPIVFKPRFDPRHNLGKDVDAEWSKYIDLERIEITNAAQGTGIRTKALQRSDAGLFDSRSAAWFERDHVITQRENSTFDIIVRHNKTGLLIDAIHGGSSGLPGHVVRFTPSRQIVELALLVKQGLGEYCAMHVRRDDMLEMKDLYPNLERDTQPDRILETLLRTVPRRSRIYIMTNERDRSFFEPLRSEFDVHQYFDFPALRDLIECEQPDNFMLFEIEKVLFEQASTKIHTFTHPEGGRRISLTSDKGWA